jgi:peptide/nickel transport system substrate-binding protein
MKETDKTSSSWRTRRSFLQAALMTGAARLLGWGVAFGQEVADKLPFKLANAKYLPLYAKRRESYFNDPQWVKETRKRLTWPKPRERVPDLVIYVPHQKTEWVDAMRKWAKDAQSLGIVFDVNLVSTTRWLQLVNTHRQDMEIHASVMRPERVDPSEYLVSRFYGLDFRNYGEQVNEQYDALIEQQNKQAKHAERLTTVQAAQRVICDDFNFNQVGWGPGLIEAYNSEAFSGMVQVAGFGISSFSMFHSYINMEPKTERRQLRIGSTKLLDTTNIIAAANTMRNIGRMIYDRLAFMSPDLKPIPWAAESWVAIDERTWDVKLRSGMHFHDGKPVTIHDLKFTFDFMLKYERGIYWSVNQFLASAEIVDETSNLMRFTFKQAFGLFETCFLQINTILPKHIWETIMADQGTSNPLALRIDVPIGSGPYKFGQYRQDVSLQLVAQKDHFSHPKLDDIWIVVTPSIDSILGRLQSGELDMVDTENAALSPTQVTQLEGMSHISIVHTPDINWLHVVNRISVLPWRDYEFRRAWMHMLDRDFLVDVAWEGGGRTPLANTPLVQGNPWNNPNLPAIPPFDLARARQILTAAGYSWDPEGRLLYPLSSDAAYRRRVEQVSKDGCKWGGLEML